MKRPPISVERARRTVESILNVEPDFAEELIDLLLGVADPDGDPTRHAVAREAARAAYTFTESFDKSFEDFLDGKVRSDEDDPERKPS